MPQRPFLAPQPRARSRAALVCALALGAAALGAGCAHDPTAAPIVASPGCLSEAQVDALFADWQARQPVANLPGLTMADAACSRARLQRRLAAKSGALVGYKAGLTNPAVQKRFHADQPVWGALYADMLLPSGAEIATAWGARPMFEADLLVRVKSRAVNHATTPAEVLAAIDQIVPFIELPDLAVAEPARLDAAALTALNVGARFGVQGEPIAVPPEGAARQALLHALASMTVRVSSGDRELARGQGSDVLGHPLNAVSWLAGALRADGLALQPGQWVSLGSFSPLLAPRSGERVSVSYDGLPGAQPVHLQFLK